MEGVGRQEKLPEGVGRQEKLPEGVGRQEKLPSRRTEQDCPFEEVVVW